MTKNYFLREGPQLASEQSGREPSLFDILVLYYSSGGNNRTLSIKFANEYMSAALAEDQKCSTVN